MAKHTQGPWTVGTSCDHTPAVVVPCPDSSGFVVAHINRLPKLGGVGGDMNANARLIAAAPELLEALGALVADVLEYERINNLAPNPGKPDCWQSITRAKAAISKATGA